MDENFKILAEVYSKSFGILHNWSLAINAGGVVAVLSYVAVKSGYPSSIILWCLGALSLGSVFGILWALINYISSLIGIKAYKMFKNTQDPHKNFELPCSVYLCNSLAWIFGALCLVCIPVGFITGFIEIIKYKIT